MAITAETRNSIIELVVTAYDAAPGTTLLTELVAIVDGGGTLADVATALTTSDRWKSLYPSFQTAEEFANAWLGTLVPEASAEALAEGVAVAVGLINGGASFGSIMIEAQSFLAGLDEADASFGSSAANFNNKVEVATEHTVNLKKDGTDDELKAVLNSVTSDDATVDAAKNAEQSGANAGQSFLLTKGVDNFTGTGGDDTFVADATTDAVSSVADTVNGGAGNDIIQLYYDDTNTYRLPGVFSAVERIYINESNTIAAAEDFSISSLSDVTSIEFDGGSTDNGGAAVANQIFDLTIGSGQKVILDSVLDGDTAADAASTDGEFEISSSSTVSSVMLELDDVGGSSALADLDVDIAGSGVTSLTVNSIGSTNYLGLWNAGGKLATLIVTGDKTLDAATDAVTTLTTIDISGSSAAAYVNVTGSTLDVNFTGGPGSDQLWIGGDLDTNDTINGGEGSDTVAVSDASLNSSVTAVGKGINAMTSIETVASTATGTITVDATKFSAIHQFGAGYGGAVTGGADAAGVSFTFGGEGNDALVVADAITGGAATAAGQDGISAVATVNTGSDVLNLTFANVGAKAITGSNGAGNGDGGDGVDASSVETINIVTASSFADVSFVGGALAGTGANGAAFKVGANATVNISGSGDVNTGTIVAPGTTTDDLTINGGGMSGKLTTATGAGNDVITGGSKGDDITAGTGVNSVTGGGGADVFKFADSSSSDTAITSITDFELGSGKDKLTFTTTAGTFETLTSANATAIAADTTLAAAAAQAATQLAAHEVTVFVFGSNAYALYEEGTAAGAYNSGTDVLVKLSGITDVSGFDATQVG